MNKKSLLEFIIGALGTALLAIVLIWLVFVAGGCTRNVYVPVETTHTEYREADTTAIYNRLRSFFESLRLREVSSDSLVDRTKETVILKENGDTAKHMTDHYIRSSSKREKELERTVAEQDSIIKHLRSRLSAIKTDTIRVPYPVKKELSKWEQAKMGFGGMAIGGVVMLFIGLCIAVLWLIKKNKK